jgi:hypothetical protein
MATATASYTRSATERPLRERRARAAQEFKGKTLTVWDYSDYDLLHMIDDNEGEPTVTFAELCECEPRSVGVRFSWLARKKLVRSQLLTADRQRAWYMATAGRRLLDSHGEGIEALRGLARDLSRSPATGWVAGREFKRSVRR